MEQEIYRTKEEITRFFKKMNLVYLDRTRVAWEPLYEQKFHKSPYYKDNEETFNDIYNKYAQYIKKKYMAPVYIKKVGDKMGYGVFAKDPITKATFVGEYAGVVQVFDDTEDVGDKENGYSTDYSWYYLDEIEGGPVLEINGRREGNEMRFVNHSETPNLDVEHILFEGQWIIFFKAARNIKKDEQLFISYGEEYWEDGFRDLSIE